MASGVVEVPVLVGGVRVRSETTLEPAGGDAVLVISTALVDHAVLLRSVYVGAGGRSPGTVVTVVLDREGRHTDTTELWDVPVTHARGRCLIHHAQSIQDWLQRAQEDQVAVQLEDRVIARAERAYPTPADPR